MNALNNMERKPVPKTEAQQGDVPPADAGPENQMSQATPGPVDHKAMLDALAGNRIANPKIRREDEPLGHTDAKE